MNPTSLPIACELFSQWRKARGDREETAARPFSRSWEDLLEDKGILSATDRADAERDARSLESEGWVTLRAVRYRSHLIERITIPLEQEARWKEAFGFTPPSDAEARLIREHDWQPELVFLRNVRVNLSFEELRQLDSFLAGGGRDRISVPIKERSLQIFGDEKRLDVLCGSSLFRDGRLTLEQLRCEIVPEPLAWKRGPAAALDRPVIVLENAATWHSYTRWNGATAQFSAVIYGGGNRFADGICFLSEIFCELGGPRPVFYFGDLDAAGLEIPQRAGRRALELGLPGIQPCMWSYGQLLTFTEKAVQTSEGAPPTAESCAWLGEVAMATLLLLADGKRLAQEHIGWELLRTHSSAAFGEAPQAQATL